MAFNIENEHIIKSLKQNERCGAKKLLKMFANKGRTLGGLRKLFLNIDC